MKKCEYCETVNKDTAKVCSSCGAKKFINICNNCKTEFYGEFCPNCGIRFSKKATVCKKCGQPYYTNFCPNCGEEGKFFTANQNGKKSIYRVLDIVRYFLTFVYCFDGFSNILTPLYAILSLLIAVSLCPLVYEKYLHVPGWVQAMLPIALIALSGTLFP